jgi:hypothetical protein
MLPSHMNSTDFYGIQNLVTGDVRLDRKSSKTCTCVSYEGTEESSKRMLVLCRWKIEEPLRLISVALSTLSVAWAITRFGTMDILWRGKRKNDYELTHHDDESKEGREESEDTEEQPEEEPEDKTQEQKAIQEQLEGENYDTKLNRLAIVYSMLNSELLNEALMYVVSLVNVVVGIATSLYFIFILALGVSPIFLIFMPFVIFRVCSPETLACLWKKIELVKEEEENLNSVKRPSWSLLCHKKTGSQKWAGDRAWRTLWLSLSPLFISTIFCLDAVIDNTNEIKRVTFHSPVAFSPFGGDQSPRILFWGKWEESMMNQAVKIQNNDETGQVALRGKNPLPSTVCYEPRGWIDEVRWNQVTSKMYLWNQTEKVSLKRKQLNLLKKNFISG